MSLSGSSGSDREKPCIPLAEGLTPEEEAAFSRSGDQDRRGEQPTPRTGAGREAPSHSARLDLPASCVLGLADDTVAERHRGCGPSRLSPRSRVARRCPASGKPTRAGTPSTMSARLVESLFGHPDTGQPYDASRMRKRFKDALRLAGVRPVRFHDLRHTFGTRMAAAGAPFRAIQEWMGHCDYTTTLIYARLRSGSIAGDDVGRARLRLISRLNQICWTAELKHFFG